MTFSFLAPVLSFFSNPRVLVILAVVGLLGVIYVRDTQQTARLEAQAAAVAALEETVAQSTAKIEGLQRASEAQQEANEVISQRLAERVAFERSVNALIRDIDRAGPSLPDGAIRDLTHERLGVLRRDAEARYPAR